MFFALNKFSLTIDRMLEKSLQIFYKCDSIFVKSIRNLTEVKKTEKFINVKMRQSGKRTIKSSIKLKS